jgi:hypothetical protein
MNWMAPVCRRRRSPPPPCTASVRSRAANAGSTSSRTSAHHGELVARTGLDGLQPHQIDATFCVPAVSPATVTSV